MKRIKNVGIGTKLILAFLIVAILCGTVGIIGILSINEISEADTLLYSKNTVGITYINDLAVNYQQLRYNALVLTIVDDDSKQKQCLENIDQYTDYVNESLTKYEALITDKDEESMFSSLSTYWDQYYQNIEKAKKYFESDQIKQASSLIINVASAKGDKLVETLNMLIEYNKTLAQEQSVLNAHGAANTTYVMIGIVSASFIAAIMLGLFIARSISRPVKQLNVAADKLAAGDTHISLKIKSRDEIGRLGKAFGNMATTIGSLISDANMLAEAATEGRLNVRADASKHKGDYKKIIAGFNKTLDDVIAPIEEASNVLAEVSKGNLASTLTGDFNGDHARMKEAINETVQTLKGYIEVISTILGDMAKGNFTSEITYNFKGDFAGLKNSINAIIHSLNDTLYEINLSADQVASGTRQISDGSQTISQGTTEQASALEQLSASVTQIAAQTKQNAEHAAYANRLSADAKQAAEDGNAQMIDMQSAMTAINVSSGNISRIIKVIDDIAFQTNILALNAAVEAARAGMHGKGFAVVAEEVRNLAGRSADAAKETAELIEGSIRKVEAGTKIADQTADGLKTILSGIDKIVELVSGIASASNEQATAISQVNLGIEQLSSVVQTNSATAQEAAASSEELSSQAEMLKAMVDEFVLKTAKPEGYQDEPEAIGTGIDDVPATNDSSCISLSDDDFGKY